MKKNLYYRSVYKRRNVVKEFILNVFYFLGSWPRLLLEVFIRRNMGERYFSFSTAIFLTIILAIMPLTYKAIYPDYFTNSYFLLTHGTYYLFLMAFFYMALKRRQEIKNLPSVYDFGRFSLSTGHYHPSFLGFTWRGELVDSRTIETIIEPGFFFIIGFVLAIFQQQIGNLIAFCSIFYSLSYYAAYRQGDHFMMDKIDEMICNEELATAFIEGKDPSETRGVNFYGRKPADPEMRRKLAKTFTEDDEIIEVK